MLSDTWVIFKGGPVQKATLYIRSNCIFQCYKPWSPASQLVLGIEEGGRMGSVGYHLKSLLLEEWGMLGLCHHGALTFSVKKPLSDHWKTSHSENLIATWTSHIRTLQKSSNCGSFVKMGRLSCHLPLWDKTCFSISVFLNLCDSQLVFFSICAFLNLCDSQLVLFSICAILN